MPPVMSPFRLLLFVLYKESVKLRAAWLVILFFNIAYMIWMYVNVRYLFRLDHPEVVWYRVIALGHAHYEAIRFVPLASGVVFACLQFLPEMKDERLRLALHLPVSSNAVVVAHLAAGLCALGALYLCNAAALVWMTFRFFPYNAVITMLLTVTPWFLAGFPGYLGVTQALLEPGIRLRVFNLLLTAGLVYPLCRLDLPGAFAGALPFLCLVPLLLLAAALLPGYHFRHRRVEG